LGTPSWAHSIASQALGLTQPQHTAPIGVAVSGKVKPWDVQVGRASRADVSRESDRQAARVFSRITRPAGAIVNDSTSRGSDPSATPTEAMSKLLSNMAIAIFISSKAR